MENDPLEGSPLLPPKHKWKDYLLNWALIFGFLTASSMAIAPCIEHRKAEKRQLERKILEKEKENTEMESENRILRKVNNNAHYLKNKGATNNAMSIFWYLDEGNPPLSANLSHEDLDKILELGTLPNGTFISSMIKESLGPLETSDIDMVLSTLKKTNPNRLALVTQYSIQEIGGFSKKDLPDLAYIAKHPEGPRTLVELNIKIPNFNAIYLRDLNAIAQVDNGLETLLLLNRDQKIDVVDESNLKEFREFVELGGYITLQNLQKHYDLGNSILWIKFIKGMQKENKIVPLDNTFWDFFENIKQKGFKLDNFSPVGDIRSISEVYKEGDKILENTEFLSTYRKLSEHFSSIPMESIDQVNILSHNPGIIDVYLPKEKIEENVSQKIKSLAILAQAKDPDRTYKLAQQMSDESPLDFLASHNVDVLDYLQKNYFKKNIKDLKSDDLGAFLGGLDQLTLEEASAETTKAMIKAIRDAGATEDDTLQMFGYATKAASTKTPDYFSSDKFKELINAAIKLQKRSLEQMELSEEGIAKKFNLDSLEVCGLLGIKNTTHPIQKADYLIEHKIKCIGMGINGYQELEDDNFEKIKFLCDNFSPDKLDTFFVGESDLNILKSKEFREFADNATKLPNISKNDLLDLAYVYPDQDARKKMEFLAPRVKNFDLGRFVGWYLKPKNGRVNHVDFDKINATGIKHLDSIEDLGIVERLITLTTPEKAGRLYEEFNIRFPNRYSAKALSETAENKKDDKPRAVLILNQSDYNGGFEGGKIDSITGKLMESGFRVMIYETNNGDNVVPKLKEIANTYGPITFALLGGHGSPTSIEYGKYDYHDIPDFPLSEREKMAKWIDERKDQIDLDTSDKENISGLGEIFERNGKYEPLLVGWACSAAQGDNSIMETLAREAKVRTIGGTEPFIVNDSKIEISDRKISTKCYTIEGKDVTREFYFPKD